MAVVPRGDDGPRVGGDCSPCRPAAFRRPPRECPPRLAPQEPHEEVDGGAVSLEQRRETAPILRPEPLEGDLDRALQHHDPNCIRNLRQPGSRRGGRSEAWSCRRSVARPSIGLRSAGEDRSAAEACEGRPRRRAVDPLHRRAMARPARAIRSVADGLRALQGEVDRRGLRSSSRSAAAVRSWRAAPTEVGDVMRRHDDRASQPRSGRSEDDRRLVRARGPRARPIAWWAGHAKSDRPPLAPHPCECVETPRGGGRGRYGGPASSMPSPASSWPVPLSAAVSLRRDRGSDSPPSFPPAGSRSVAPFPPPGPLGRVPRHRRYYGALRLPAARPTRGRAAVCCFVDLHSTVPLRCPPFAPLIAEARAIRSLEIVVRLPGPLVCRQRRQQGLPRSWGSLVRVRRVLGPRPGLDARPIAASRCCPRTQARAMAPALSLSRFDGRLSRYLCTLRRAGLPATTQHSVPAAGHALPGGVRTRRDPLRGFGMTHVMASSSSSRRGASLM